MPRVLKLLDRYRVNGTEAPGDMRRAPRLEIRWSSARVAMIALLYCLRIGILESLNEL